MTTKYSIYKDILEEAADKQLSTTITCPNSRIRERVYQALNRYRRQTVDADRAARDAEIDRAGLDAPMVGEKDAPHRLETLTLSRLGENEIKITYEDPYDFYINLNGEQVHYGWFAEASRLSRLAGEDAAPKLGYSSEAEYMKAWIRFREENGGRYFDQTYRQEKMRIQEAILGAKPAGLSAATETPQQEDSPAPPDSQLFGDSIFD